MPIKNISELCALVRETAYAIHLYHGHGHLEKVYENALAHRLDKAGLHVKQQHPITVFDESDSRRILRGFNCRGDLDCGTQGLPRFGQ
jgi:GxxExxY protein